MLHHVMKPPRRFADLPIFLAQLRKQETMLLSASTVAFPLQACGFDPNKDPAQNVPVVVLQL